MRLSIAGPATWTAIQHPRSVCLCNLQLSDNNVLSEGTPTAPYLLRSLSRMDEIIDEQLCNSAKARIQTLMIDCLWSRSTCRCCAKPRMGSRSRLCVGCRLIRYKAYVLVRVVEYKRKIHPSSPMTPSQVTVNSSSDNKTPSYYIGMSSTKVKGFLAMITLLLVDLSRPRPLILSASDWVF